MKRLLLLGLSISALVLAQHGRAVRAGGGPKVQAHQPVKAATPQVAKQGAGPQARTKAQVSRDILTHLEKHPNAAARLQALLPADMPVETAAEGFKNFGQFNAAVHVSKNLGIPFDQLKLEMTGENPKSLGQAIQTLRPQMSEEDVNQAVVQAEVQVKADASAVREQERLQTRLRDRQPAAPAPQQ